MCSKNKKLVRTGLINAIKLVLKKYANSPNRALHKKFFIMDKCAILVINLKARTKNKNYE